MKKLYIAGPMRGYPRFNFDRFAASARSLREAGYAVVSPAEMDLEDGDFDPDNPGEITKDRYERWMRRDLRALADCDAIFLLPGWQNSEGAKRELAFALAMNLEVIPCA